MKTSPLRNLLGCALLALVLVCLSACAARTHQGQRGPRCLGPVCLDADIWKDAGPFFAKYGSGTEQTGKFPACWYEENGVSVDIGRYHGENRPINAIVVSRYPFHARLGLPPKQSFGPLVTERGIGLGATFQEVVETYGTPNQLSTNRDAVRREVPDDWPVDVADITIARYETIRAEDDYGSWSVFFFENNVLIAIELSNAL